MPQRKISPTNQDQSLIVRLVENVSTLTFSTGYGQFGQMSDPRVGQRHSDDMRYRSQGIGDFFNFTLKHQHPPSIPGLPEVETSLTVSC